MATIHCAGYIFNSNFDSGNLAKVECIPKHESVVVPVHRHGKDVPEIPDVEFNIWTRPDCMGTEFENGNRTWFYFGVKGYKPSVLMKLNLVDLNRQAKMYSQGMAPVFKTIPGRPNWERIRDKPTYTVIENIFTLSFKFKTPENADTIMYFAFTYPYTYTDLQNSLLLLDQKFLSMDKLCTPPSDEIYYVRELVCKSLEGRRVDLITISSLYNITSEREKRLKFLFPHEDEQRPFKFKNKKIIFISARVHPGETPSSFVFNGLLNYLLRKDDPVPQQLRRNYVFKMIPFLNPDGVARGHYRTDTRGINLNRMYLEPTLAEHPSVFAARKLLLYYHFGYDCDEANTTLSGTEIIRVGGGGSSSSNYSSENKMAEGVQILSLEEKESKSKLFNDTLSTCASCHELFVASNMDDTLSLDQSPRICCPKCMVEQKDSRLFIYIDMHGHASKKGIFMYGNHFEDMDKNVECMLLPKILSLNNHNFHFNACNFTERNMYLRDRRDGMSREGSGRVAVLKLTGLVQSYTLECNYNSGRMVNVLPPTVKEGNKQMHCLPVPPKYTPHIFEEVGAAIAISILDLTGQNPYSRIPNSEFHSLTGLRDWLRVNYYNEMGIHPKVSRPKATLQTAVKPRPRTMRNLAVKRRATTSKLMNRKTVTTKTGPIPIERKENIVVQSRDSNSMNSSQSVSVCYSASSSCSRMFNRSTKTKGLSIRKSAKNQRNKISPKQTSNRSCQTSNTSLNIELVSETIATSTATVTASTESVPTTTTSTTQIKPLKESPKRAKVTGTTMAHDSQHSDRLKLREICFIKENMTKKLIAKFSSSESAQDIDDDDDLVVAWDPTYSPKVLSKFHSRTNLTGGASGKIDNNNPEPSCSKQNKGPFKSTPFATIKCKNSKSSLRRLTSSDGGTTGKVDKMKKRKKLKAFKPI